LEEGIPPGESRVSGRAISGVVVHACEGRAFCLTVVYGKPLIVFGRLAWAHDFVSNPSLSAACEALPDRQCAPNPHDSALTTAGAQLILTPNWTLLAKFEGEFAPGSQTYAGTGTLRHTW
jgi:uncharacterized protein with beta-barrel porin domain